MRDTVLKILRFLVVLFLVIGIVGWFLPFHYPSGWQLSLSQPRGIDIDNEGNIYCGSGFYCRIQKYTPNGKFIKGFVIGGRGFFDFHITEKQQLQVLNYKIKRVEDNWIDRTDIYDLDGNLLDRKEYPTKKQSYKYPKKNSIRIFGNVYSLQGFLFPKVVKRTSTREESVVIKTPIHIWFIQAPFPAFAFFFVSMFIIILTAEKAILLRTILNYIFNKKRYPKLLITILLLPVIAIALGFLIIFGFEKCPLILIIGFISFWITGFLVWIISAVYMIVSHIYLFKHHRQLWKAMFRHSLKERMQASNDIRSLNDPFLSKITMQWNKAGLFLFKLWLIVFVLVVVGYLVWYYFWSNSR